MVPFIAIFDGWTQMRCLSGQALLMTLYKTWRYVLDSESNRFLVHEP